MMADDCLDLPAVRFPGLISRVEPRLPQLQPTIGLDNPQKALRARPIPRRTVEDGASDAQECPRRRDESEEDLGNSYI